MPILLTKNDMRDLVFSKFKSGTILKNATVVHASGVTLIVSSRGALYTTALRDFAYLPSLARWTRPLMNCLVRAGVITTAEREAHLDNCARADENSKKRANRENLQYYAERAGIKLTKAQLKKIEAE